MENKDFAENTAEPQQTKNREWWETRPMTYDWEGTRHAEEGTLEWFKALDSEFWSISQEFAHPGYPHCRPFSALINYNELAGKKVLEIGCGMGAQALVFAEAGAIVTAVDLTERAVKMSNLRFKLFGIRNAQAQQADAERLPFPDGEFDFVWSWGVIHHSSHTDDIVKEIHRVLKDNGTAKIMIYHKNSTRYYIHGLYHGIFLLKFLKHRSLYAVNMTFTDGYVARHYTRREARKLFNAFKDTRTWVMDAGAPSLIFGWGRISRLWPKAFAPINQWINRRWGWFLFIEAQK